MRCFVENKTWANQLSPLGIATGYFLVAAVFGLMTTESGIDWWFAPLMCAAVYAGASQFAALTLMLNGAPLLSIVSAAFLINARHILMVAYMANRIRDLNWSALQKVTYAALLTDESFAFHSKYDNCVLSKANNMIMFNFYCYSAWIFGGLTGGLITHVVRKMDGLSLKFALTAMLVYVLITLIDSRIKVMATFFSITFLYGLTKISASQADIFVATVAGCGLTICTARSD